MAKLVLCCAVVLLASVAAQLNVGNAAAPRTNMTKNNSTIATANSTSTTGATTTTTPRTNVTKNSTTLHQNVGNATAPKANLTKKNSTITITRATTENSTTTRNTTTPRTNVTKKNSTTSHRNVGNSTAPKANLTKRNSTIATTTATTTLPGKNVTKKNSTTSHSNIGNATAPKANLTKRNSTIVGKITTSATTNPVTLQHHSIVETRLGMNLGISNPTSFNKMSMVEAVANASGVSSADVALVFKRITVEVIYTFSETINETSATQAVATANSVSISQVVVQIISTRRLGQGSKPALGRRLVATVAATITVPNVTQAKAVHSSSSNNVALQSALASQGFAISVPTISIAPKIQAQVEMTITTGSSQAGSLSAQQLANVASQIGGTVAVTSVSVMTITATTTNASISTTAATIRTTNAGNSNTDTTTTQILPDNARGNAAPLFGKPIVVLFVLAALWLMM